MFRGTLFRLFIDLLKDHCQVCCEMHNSWLLWLGDQVVELEVAGTADLV